MGTSLDPKDPQFFGNLIISDTSSYKDSFQFKIEASTGYVTNTLVTILSIIRSPNQAPLFVDEFESTLTLNLNEGPSASYILPKAFDPNGDAFTKTVFFPKAVDFATYENDTILFQNMREGTYTVMIELKDEL